MKILKRAKDGGEDSSVDGFWIFEFKNLFSIVFLKFNGKSREAYHEHAFNSLSWLFRGKLIEQFIEGGKVVYKPSLMPIITKRDTYHKVDSEGISYVISFRGPWAKTWKEYIPAENKEKTLTNGRVELHY